MPRKAKNGADQLPAKDAAETWFLRLYVAGETPRATAALANLKNSAKNISSGRYQIEVVDLLKNPRTGGRRPDSGRPDSGAQAAAADEKAC